MNFKLYAIKCNRKKTSKNKLGDLMKTDVSNSCLGVLLMLS